MTTDFDSTSGWLRRPGGQAIAYTVSGAADGIPALVLHGGPGSGSSPRHLEFFDLRRYRVIQFDQRGSGRSLPAATTRRNTTAHLLADIDALRRRLDIARWLVVGGSWGASLAALYAARQRQRVSGVLMRGLFVTGWRAQEWFLATAAAKFPQAWRALLEAVPEWADGQRLLWLTQVFAGGDAATQARVARAWTDWERVLSGQPPVAPESLDLAAACQRYRVHCHYLRQRCWSDAARVSGACRRLDGLPALLLHGAGDAVCPPAMAWRATRALGDERRHLVAAGHDPFHPAMAAAMCAALDHFARQRDFNGLSFSR